MGTGQWIAVAAGALVVLAVGGVLLWRRRLSRIPQSDRIAKEAHRALRALSQEQRQRRKGSLRGQGQGGDENLAIDYGVASEPGGAP